MLLIRWRGIVRTWIREHNQQVKASGKGVRILPLFLPTQSPWLNPIKPKWVHGKRTVVEPNGLLSAKQLTERICAYYHCSYEAPLSIQENVSCECARQLKRLGACLSTFVGVIS